MNTHKLESFLFEKMRTSNLPGLSIALVSGDELVYARGFGQRDVARGYPATPETLYSIGSITKSFTVIGILQLAEQGLLSLEDAVSKHLSGFTLSPEGETVRLKHLMMNATGMPALAYSEALIGYYNKTGGRYLPIAGSEDILTFMQDAHDWAETKPGERWFYFNEGFALLGLIIEKLSGQTYNDYIQQHILTPLGMQRSFLNKEHVDNDPNAAVPYVIYQDGHLEPGHYLYRTIRSEGGLISNTIDMSHYLRALMNHGAPLINRASFDAMSSPHVPLPYRNLQDSSPVGHYGFGLQTKDFFGSTLLSHGGSVLVATAQLTFLPEEQLGVVLLTNGSGYSTALMAEYALALMLGEDPDALLQQRNERLLKKLTGQYETYKQTMNAHVVKHGDFLKLIMPNAAQPEEVILVPELLNEDASRFFTLVNGAKLQVDFRQKAGVTELVFQRYKFRRVC